MFFKNLRIYKITEPLALDAGRLEQALNEHKFTPCMGQDALKIGFCYPLHPSLKQLAHFIEGGELVVVALKRQEKALPAAVINEELQPKIDALQAEKGRPLGRKEKQVLKEELIQTLLPRALSRSTVTRALIDQQNGLLFVDASTANRAEDLLALLRKALGSLPAVPWIDSNQLSQRLQDWLSGLNLPAGIVRGHAVKLKAPDEEGAKASFDNHLLTAAEVQSHLEDKLVTELELQQVEQLTFRVTECGGIKKLHWHELLANKNDELGWDDLEYRLDADYLLMVNQLREVIKAVQVAVLGERTSLDLRTIVSESSETHEQPTAEPANKSPIWNAEDEDPLYQDAVRFVVECQKVSVSAIQRKFRIGYNRSAWIVEAMERRCVVSKMGHYGNRTVLLREVAA